MAKKKQAITRRLQAWAIVGMLRLPLVLPYRPRLAVVAWLMAWVVGPIAGYRRRIRENLGHVLPDLPEAEVRRLCRAVPANTGRMLMESSSGRDFTDRIDRTEMQGPGVPALDEARQTGRPIVVVSAHFGNFDAARRALAQRGHHIGALYRPIDDPYLDRHFLESLTSIADPIFPRGRKGLGQMLRFLRQGNTLAILPDQHVNKGEPLTFFGKTALTTLSPAEMALKYEALLIPVYGIRRGMEFEIIAEDPIPHTDARTMMQAVNDSLERRVRENMDQWLWIHRRWKPERQRARAAARMRR